MLDEPKESETQHTAGKAGEAADSATVAPRATSAGKVAAAALPAAAIVGRVNVGKSSLFNRLARQRLAIVDPTPGVTRDRLTTPIRHQGRRFELIDTGGLGGQGQAALRRDIEQQVEIALRRADAVVYVVDVRSGLLPLDEEIARRLRLLDKPIILAANKADTPQLADAAQEFHALGLGEPLPVSAAEGLGRGDLLDRIVALLPESTGPETEEEFAIAIVGRRNVGKSTFVNQLAHEERVIVSEVPGTTRDAIDVRFEVDGRGYLAIDTAGLRRRGKVEDSVEFFSIARTKRAIRRADVVLLLMDITEPVGQLEKQLASEIEEQSKPVILVLNKWDLAQGYDPRRFGRYVDRVLPGLAFAPVALVSAKEGVGVLDTLGLARELYRQASTRVTTGQLNRVVEEAMRIRGPHRRARRPPKLFYVTQVQVRPPTLVLFVNNPSIFDAAFSRFLGNYLRKHLPYSEVPIRIFFRARRREELPPASAGQTRPRQGA
jgi:GTP-binding protein